MQIASHTEQKGILQNRRFIVLAGLVAIGLLATSLVEPLPVLGWLVAGGAAAVVLIKPNIGLALLVPALFFEADQFSLMLPFGRVRLYHVLVFLLFVRVVFDVATGRSQWRKTVLDWPIAAYLLLNISLIAVAPDVRVASRMAGLLVLLGLLYWTVTNLVRTRQQYLAQLRLLIVSTVGIALFGLFQVAAVWLASRYDIKLWSGPIIHSDVIPYGRPYATFVEPDWYGTIMAAALVALALASFAKAFAQRQVELLGATLIVLIATLLSAVRGAWLAVGISVPLLLWLNRRYIKVLNGRILRNVTIVTLALAALVLLVTPTMRTALLERAGSLTTSATLQEEPRFLIMQDGWQIFSEHPWLGRGPAAYTSLGTLPFVTPMYANIVGLENFQTNALLTILIDTGLVGLALMIWLALRFSRTVWKAVKTRASDLKGEQIRTATIALAGAVLVLALAYQASSGIWLGLTWYLISLTIAGSMIRSNNSQVKQKTHVS
ncbi:MAG: O-antigen ligase family protein [Parcubacteria group bacterium]